MEASMCTHAVSQVHQPAPYESVVSERLHARSLAALMAAYPSTSPSTAAFDQYSEYSDDCSADSEAPGLTPYGGAMKSFKNPLSKRCDGTSSGDESLSTGLSMPWQHKDLVSASFQDESSTLSEDELNQRCTTSNEMSTDSHYEPSTADSDSEGDDEEPVTKPSSRVYSMALLLRIQAVVAACASSPMPTSRLSTKRIDELPAMVPSTSHKKEKRAIPRAASEKPVSKQRGSAATASGNDEKMTKFARSALAALSAERVDAVCDKLAQGGIHTTAQLVMVLREIAEKAVGHHQFTSACADLCVRLKSDSRFEAAAGPEGGPQSYRQLLLDECWPRYQQLLDDRIDDGCCESDQELRKKHALGNMKFMGDLITRGLMSPRLLVDCAEALVNRHLSQSGSVESLEAVVALLMAGCAHVDKMSNWVHAARLSSVFAKVRTLAHDQAVPLSVRLLLRDVLSLRETGWRLRGGAVAVPTKNRIEEARSLQGTRLSPPEKDLNKQRQPPQAADVSIPSSKQSMLSLAREMLLAPVNPASGRAVRPGPRPPKTVPAGPAPPVQVAPAPVASSSSNSAPVSLVALPFDPKAFHRELSATLRDLASDGNATAAVRRIRAQNVPLSHQSREFTDLLTRACEVSRKAARHSAFAFAAGLAAATPSAFDRAECLSGVSVFFREVYDDLCEEVPQLPSIVEREMMPTLRSVYSSKALDELLPETLQASSEGRKLE